MKVIVKTEDGRVIEKWDAANMAHALRLQAARQADWDRTLPSIFDPKMKAEIVYEEGEAPCDATPTTTPVSGS